MACCGAFSSIRAAFVLFSLSRVSSNSEQAQAAIFVTRRPPLVLSRRSAAAARQRRGTAWHRRDVSWLAPHGTLLRHLLVRKRAAAQGQRSCRFAASAVFRAIAGQRHRIIVLAARAHDPAQAIRTCLAAIPRSCSTRRRRRCATIATCCRRHSTSSTRASRSSTAISGWRSGTTVSASCWDCRRRWARQACRSTKLPARSRRCRGSTSSNVNGGELADRILNADEPWLLALNASERIVEIRSGSDAGRRPGRDLARHHRPHSRLGSAARSQRDAGAAGRGADQRTREGQPEAGAGDTGGRPGECRQDALPRRRRARHPAAAQRRHGSTPRPCWNGWRTPATKHCVQNISKSLESVEEILGALLAISRLDSGRQEIKAANFPVAAAVRPDGGGIRPRRARKEAGTAVREDLGMDKVGSRAAAPPAAEPRSPTPSSTRPPARCWSVAGCAAATC